MNQLSFIVWREKKVLCLFISHLLLFLRLAVLKWMWVWAANSWANDFGWGVWWGFACWEFYDWYVYKMWVFGVWAKSVWWNANRNVIFWMELISAYAKSRNMENARKLFDWFLIFFGFIRVNPSDPWLLDQVNHQFRFQNYDKTWLQIQPYWLLIKLSPIKFQKHIGTRWHMIKTKAKSK